jgi:rRNA processing protein Gar1
MARPALVIPGKVEKVTGALRRPFFVVELAAVDQKRYSALAETMSVLRFTSCFLASK